MNHLIIIIVLLHGAGCLLSLYLSITSVLQFRPAALPLMLLVPVFGPAAVLFLGFSVRKHSQKSDAEDPGRPSETEIYRTLNMDGESLNDGLSMEKDMIMNLTGSNRNLAMDIAKENVVPLEDALAISTSQVRRKIMMDVLNSDTDQFYELLEQARLNDDVEVVHYATTAMSELNKKYDLALDKLRTAVDTAPKDLQVLAEYCSQLQQYMELGLAKGVMLNLRRSECILMLKRLCNFQPTYENYCALARQQMLHGEISAADETLQEAEIRWPDSETVWLLRLEYYARQGDGQTVQAMASNVWNSDMYLSANVKEKLAFWLKKGSRV